MPEPQLHYGKSFRNFQFIWWGWRRAVRCRPRFALEPARPPLDKTWRWWLLLGPLEVRRWAEDWRDQRARLLRERGHTFAHTWPLQLVWWGWRWAWFFDRLPPDDSLSTVYAWRLCLGPLEIRRWVPDPAAALAAYRAAWRGEERGT